LLQTFQVYLPYKLAAAKEKTAKHKTATLNILMCVTATCACKSVWCWSRSVWLIYYFYFLL